MWGLEDEWLWQLRRKGLCLRKTSVGTANLGLAVPEGRGTAELFPEPVLQGWLCSLLACALEQPSWALDLSPAWLLTSLRGLWASHHLLMVCEHRPPPHHSPPHPRPPHPAQPRRLQGRAVKTQKAPSGSPSTPQTSTEHSPPPLWATSGSNPWASPSRHLSHTFIA